MPFSSLSDPNDLARAVAALEAVWSQIKDEIAEPDHEKERTKIAYMVTSCAALALDEDELTLNVLHLYRQQAAD